MGVGKDQSQRRARRRVRAREPADGTKKERQYFSMKVKLITTTCRGLCKICTMQKPRPAIFSQANSRYTFITGSLVDWLRISTPSFLITTRSSIRTPPQPGM